MASGRSEPRAGEGDTNTGRRRARYACEPAVDLAEALSARRWRMPGRC